MSLDWAASNVTLSGPSPDVTDAVATAVGALLIVPSKEQKPPRAGMLAGVFGADFSALKPKLIVCPAPITGLYCSLTTVYGLLPEWLPCHTPVILVAS